MKKILLSIFALAMGMASSYAQCSGGLFRNGVSDDMSVISAAGVAGTGYAPKGYYGVNWYPTPDSVVNTVSDPNYFSYQKYQLSRLTNPGKMTVTANAADTLFRTFGIGFSVPVDLSNAATMSIDVDNSAQPNTPLFFTANLTDWNGYQIQYMADTLSQYNALYPLYDDSYKKKFTDTISASTSTVYTSYKATPWYVNNSGYSTTNSVTTVNFNFAGGWQIDSALSDSGYPVVPIHLAAFPCSYAVPQEAAQKADGHVYAFYCPHLKQPKPGEFDGAAFDWTHVLSIAFYINGGGCYRGSLAAPTAKDPNPSFQPGVLTNPNYLGVGNGVTYSVFTGTVLLDNFVIGYDTGQTYQYGTPSGSYQSVCLGTTAVTSATPQVTASIYPNPVSAASGYVTISDNGAPFTITLTNSVGAIVSTSIGSSFNSPSAPGMYFVTYTSSNGGGIPRTMPLVVK